MSSENCKSSTLHLLCPLERHFDCVYVHVLRCEVLSMHVSIYVAQSKIDADPCALLSACEMTRCHPHHLQILFQLHAAMQNA